MCKNDFYTAITQNNREIDRVHNYGLYIATVSIKHKAVDHIKTALRFWSNATRKSARLTSKRTMFVTSISTIVMERYISEQTGEKKVILQRIALPARRYRRFRLRNVSVPVVKINKMADSGAPRVRANEVGFWVISSATVAV